MESVIKQKMICYADLLHGDEPAEKIADEIYQYPRISRSLLGAREHKAMLSKPEFIISLRGYLDGMKSDGMTAITANDMRVFPGVRSLCSWNGFPCGSARMAVRSHRLKPQSPTFG